MTSQGSASGRFQREIESGQLFHADLAARELGRLSLADVDLFVLIAKDDPRRYGRAAARRHGRFALESKGFDLAASQLVLAALGSLPTDVDGARALLERIGDRYSVRLRSVRRAVGRRDSPPSDFHGTVPRSA